MNWKPYSKDLWSSQELPPQHKLVLLAFARGALGDMSAPATAVGYMKLGAGDPDSPYFVTPGIGGDPSHWCDCLPEDFGRHGVHPHWNFPQRTFPSLPNIRSQPHAEDNA